MPRDQVVLVSLARHALLDSVDLTFGRRAWNLRFGRPAGAGFSYIQKIGVLSRVWEETR